jgi:hypothetical protein
MKYKDEDPDNLGGLGDLLPTEVLQKVNELLEQLHWTDHTNQGSKIEFVYVASGGQHVDTIQTQNVYTINRQELSKNKYTDQQMADAISSINGKGKVLDEYQKWLGICCYVSARCGYPMDLESCCQRLANLPYKTPLEYVPQYKSIRVYATWNFVKAGYEQWSNLRVNDQERNLFIKCHDTALALVRALSTRESA